MEDLLNKRFNWFMVFYSIVVVGALQAKQPFVLQAMLIVGAGICGLLTLTLIRAQRKLNIILKHLGKLPSHPVSITNRAMGTFERRLTMRRIIGYVIPPICTLTLIAGAILLNNERLYLLLQKALGYLKDI